MSLVATNFSRNVMMLITTITLSLMGSCSVARMCKLVIFTIALLRYHFRSSLNRW